MKTVKLLAALTMTAVLSGCMTTVNPYECANWNIECTDRASVVADKPKFGVARLSLVELRAPYVVREIAVLRANGSIAFDPCNAYAASPVQLLKGVAFEALSRCGLFDCVIGTGSSADADVEVEVVVTRLALDCRGGMPRRAVAALSVRLVRSHEIAAFVTGSGSADASAPDFSASFSQAVTDAFSDALKKL